MKTWNDYKAHVNAVDPVLAGEIGEAEELALIVSAMIEQRNALGISQRELAEICGIPQSSIARIETLKTTPNLSTLLRIMKPLGLTFSVVPVQA